MTVQENNFGLGGHESFYNYEDDGYDHLFKKFKERREEKRADKKQHKEDKRSEKQEKKEANNEKRRLKNDLKQTQIDERKAQLSALTKETQNPPPPPPAAASEQDNSMMMVAGAVGLIVLVAGVAYMMKSKPAPGLQQRAFAQAA